MIFFIYLFNINLICVTVLNLIFSFFYIVSVIFFCHTVLSHVVNTLRYLSSKADMRDEYLNLILKLLT